MYHGVLQWSKLMCKHQVDISISIENVTASGSGIINTRSYFCDTRHIPDTRTRWYGPRYLASWPVSPAYLICFFPPCLAELRPQASLKKG